MRTYSRTGRLPREEIQVRDGGGAAEKYRRARGRGRFFRPTPPRAAPRPGRVPIFPDGNRQGKFNYSIMGHTYMNNPYKSTLLQGLSSGDQRVSR